AAFARAGLGHALPAQLFTAGAPFFEDVPEGERDIDALFIGNLQPAVQRLRLPWLGRLARLAERFRVRVATNVFGDAYRALLRRARVVLNRSVRGECNARAVEAAACGALVFNERGNDDVGRLFADGREHVLYGEDDLEALLTRYLTREEERAAVAAAGRRRALT